MSFKSARLSKGMTLKQAADAIGVSAQAVSLWETGQTMPSAKNLKALADVLGVSVDDLLSEES